MQTRQPPVLEGVPNSRAAGEDTRSRKTLLGVWGVLGDDEGRHMKLTDAAGTQNCHCVAGKGSEMPSTLCSFSNGAFVKVIL